jgi:hypothetical protein
MTFNTQLSDVAVAPPESPHRTQNNRSVNARSTNGCLRFGDPSAVIVKGARENRSPAFTGSG